LILKGAAEMISTRGRYAVRVMIDLAEHGEEGFVPLKEVAERQEISKKYLEIIMKDMVAGGLVQGASGKGGGYRLCRRPEEYPIGEVLELMEGSLSPVACLTEGKADCPRRAACRTLPLWKGLDETVRGYLGQFSIRSLMRSDEGGFDYVI
jgi:Rrf2 family protein